MIEILFRLAFPLAQREESIEPVFVQLKCVFCVKAIIQFTLKTRILKLDLPFSIGPAPEGFVRGGEVLLPRMA